MVPLLHRAWGEVKTMVLGVLGPSVHEKGEGHVHATVETHRRGTARAGTMCAVNDGAEWEPAVVSDHRPDAVRILDWGHRAEHVSAVARAVFGSETLEEKAWRKEHLRALKVDTAPPLLAELHRLRDALATEDQNGTHVEARRVVEANLLYFTKRAEQIRYAEFAEKGYPIGSGAVESGNKLVVEAWLKGSGMNGAPENVNPLVALRTVACSDRWEEEWLRISERLRERTKERAVYRQIARQTAPKAHALTEIPTVPDEPTITIPTPRREAPPSDPPPTDQTIAETTRPPAGSRKPAAYHPWRRQPRGKALYRERRFLAS